MKRLEDKVKEEKAEEKKKVRRAGIWVFLSVCVLFFVIICVTEGISMFYGKTAGNVALVIIAIFLVFMLYRKEITTFFKKK